MSDWHHDLVTLFEASDRDVCRTIDREDFDVAPLAEFRATSIDRTAVLRSSAFMVASLLSRPFKVDKNQQS